ncbi:hypothetical protein SNEBB_001675 [Seison nebaliae]|nr:hypothetical protein SNEBB_001675 [Seison nebaliae]
MTEKSGKTNRKTTWASSIVRRLKHIYEDDRIEHSTEKNGTDKFRIINGNREIVIESNKEYRIPTISLTMKGMKENEAKKLCGKCERELMELTKNNHQQSTSQHCPLIQLGKLLNDVLRKESGEVIRKSEEIDQETIDDDIVVGKKKMRTSEDVIQRLMWNQELGFDLNEVSVGYVDRFIGIVEKKFREFDWGDIASCEKWDLAIPRHRIEYFKYYDEKIWDKRLRLDNVFASVGENVTSLDKTINRIHQRLNKTGRTIDIPVNRTTKSTTTTVISTEEKGEKYEKVKTGGYDNDKNDAPTHFLAVTPRSFELDEQLSKIQECLLNCSKDFLYFFIPRSAAHITLFTLRIEDHEMEQVLQLMNEEYEKLSRSEKYKELFSKPINMKFGELNTFYSKVLYVECIFPPLFTQFRHDLYDKLIDQHVRMCGNYYEFVPHLTIMKISRRRPVMANCNIKNIPLAVYQSSKFLLRDYEAELMDIHLFQMSFGGQRLIEGQIYKELLHVCWPSE